jgi:hypothetical protein
MRVILAIDVILEALIGPNPSPIERLLAQAKAGQVELVVLHHALYCALRSVGEQDTLNIARLAELVKYARIEPTPHLKPEEGGVLEPTQEEIENWRADVLQRG